MRVWLMQVNPVYITRPELAGTGAEPFYIPLPGYELTDEFQNGIPVARPIPPDIPSLPGFPLPEALPTLPGTTILDPGDLPTGSPGFGEGLDPFSPEDYILYATTAEGVQIRIPQNHGHWDGIPGESGWHSNLPEVIAVTGGVPILFRNGFPDFGPWTQMRVPLENMKGNYTTALARVFQDRACASCSRSAGPGGLAPQSVDISVDLNFHSCYT